MTTVGESSLKRRGRCISSRQGPPERPTFEFVLALTVPSIIIPRLTLFANWTVHDGQILAFQIAPSRHRVRVSNLSAQYLGKSSTNSVVQNRGPLASRQHASRCDKAALDYRWHLTPPFVNARHLPDIKQASASIVRLPPLMSSFRPDPKMDVDAARGAKRGRDDDDEDLRSGRAPSSQRPPPSRAAPRSSSALGFGSSTNRFPPPRPPSAPGPAPRNAPKPAPSPTKPKPSVASSSSTANPARAEGSGSGKTKNRRKKDRQKEKKRQEQKEREQKDRKGKGKAKEQDVESEEEEEEDEGTDNESNSSDSSATAAKNRKRNAAKRASRKRKDSASKPGPSDSEDSDDDSDESEDDIPGHTKADAWRLNSEYLDKKKVKRALVSPYPVYFQAHWLMAAENRSHPFRHP